MHPRSHESTFDRRYTIVAGAFLTQAVVIGTMFSYGVFFEALEQELGWSRTLLASCSSMSFLVMGIFAVVAGRLTDRLGPRIVLSVSGVIYGLGFVLMYWMHSPWQLFILFGLLIGIGLATHDVVTLSAIARWFARRRGMMTGIAKIGTATGQILIPVIAAILITAVGWRTACLIIGLCAAALLVFAAQGMRKAEAQAATSTDADGLSAAQARRTRQFWMLCIVQFCFLPSLVTVPVHLVVHATDLGMAAKTAATLLSVVGAMSILGRIVIGMLADRAGSRIALVLCFAVLFASLVMLRTIDTPNMLFVIIALYGFAHGGFFTVMSPAVAENFGMKAHSSIFGVVVFFGTLSAAFGPIVAGRIFDTSGSYALAFNILIGLAFVGLCVAFALRKPAASA